MICLFKNMPRGGPSSLGAWANDNIGSPATVVLTFFFFLNPY